MGLDLLFCWWEGKSSWHFLKMQKIMIKCWVACCGNLHQLPPAVVSGSWKELTIKCTIQLWSPRLPARLELTSQFPKGVFARGFVSIGPLSTIGIKNLSVRTQLLLCAQPGHAALITESAEVAFWFSLLPPLSLSEFYSFLLQGGLWKCSPRTAILSMGWKRLWGIATGKEKNPQLMPLSHSALYLLGDLGWGSPCLSSSVKGEGQMAWFLSFPSGLSILGFCV